MHGGFQFFIQFRVDQFQVLEHSDINRLESRFSPFSNRISALTVSGRKAFRAIQSLIF